MKRDAMEKAPPTHSKPPHGSAAVSSRRATAGNAKDTMPDTIQKKAASKADIFDCPESFAATLTPGGRLIGIDGGTKTLGLALSDVNLTIASALQTIRRKKFKHDVETLLALANEHGVVGFVLGLPANMDGTEGPRAQSARAFARNLAAIDTRPILLWDERLSTVAAERVLLAADTSRAKRAGVIDKLAATVILQTALDRLGKLST